MEGCLAYMSDSGIAQSESDRGAVSLGPIGELDAASGPDN